MDATTRSGFYRLVEMKPLEIKVTGSYADELWREYIDERKKQKTPAGYFRKALWADRDNWMTYYKVKSYKEQELVFEQFNYDRIP